MANQSQKRGADGTQQSQDAFTQTVYKLSGLLDTHLHGKGPATKSHDKWQDCFCAILLALNPESKLTDMLEALPAQSKGMDQTSLLNAMVNMGHYARSVGTTARLFDQRLAPALFVPKRKDLPPYIIINADGQNVTIFDPAARRLRTLGFDHPRINRLGRAYFFQTFDRNRQSVSKFIRGGSKQSWFRALLGRFTTTLRQIFLIGLGLNIAALAPPIYMMAVYDRVVSPSDAFSLWALASGISIALLAEYAFRRTRSDALS